MFILNKFLENEDEELTDELQTKLDYFSGHSRPSHTIDNAIDLLIEELYDLKKNQYLTNISEL